MEVDRHDVVELDEDHAHWQGLLLAALNLIVGRHVTSYGWQVAYLGYAFTGPHRIFLAVVFNPSSRSVFYIGTNV